MITNEEFSVDPSQCHYGDNRNLTFIMPAKGFANPFNWPQRFRLSAAKHVLKSLHAEKGKFLNVHIRYNKGPVNLLFP